MRNETPEQFTERMAQKGAYLRGFDIRAEAAQSARQTVTEQAPKVKAKPAPKAKPKPKAKPAPRPKPVPQPKQPRTRAATPTECARCHRPLRPRNAKAVDHPGTVEHRSGGICASCAARPDGTPSGQPRPVKAKPAPKVRLGLGKCSSCERQLRPGGTTLEQYPDTVGHNGGGTCVSCARRGGKPPTIAAPPQKCRDCGEPMYGGSLGPKTEGARRHWGRGYCRECHPGNVDAGS